MKKIRELILKTGPNFLIFILPIIYFNNRVYPHITSKTFFFNGMVEIFLGLWIFSILTDYSYRITRKTFFYFIPVIVFLCWMTISGVLAVNPSLSFWSSFARGTGLITLYHCLLFAFIVASLVKKYGTEYIISFMKWFLWGAGILAVSIWLGVSGFNINYSFAVNDHAGGLVGNSSLAAAYSMFALAFGIFILTFKSISKKQKYFIGIVIAIIITSPLFIDIHGFFVGTGILGTARGALLGVIVAVIVYFIWYMILSNKKNIQIIGLILLFISFSVFSIGWIKLIAPNTLIHNEFSKVASPTRFVFWDIASKAIKEHPFFGYGPENYMIAFQHYFDSKLLLKEYNHESWNDRAHNIFYDIGVSGGYPAILFYLVFILSLLYAIYKKYKIGQFTQNQSAILFGLIFGYVFQNLFVFDCTISLVALFSFSGIIYSFNGNSLIKEKIKNNIFINESLKYLLILVLFVICFISWIFFDYLPAKKSKVYVEVFSSATEKQYDNLLKGSIIGEQWDVSQIAHDAYNYFSSNAIQIKNNKQALPYIEKDLENFLKYLEIVATRNKTDYRLYSSIIYLYSTQIYFTDKGLEPLLIKHILEISDSAKQLSPTNPEIYWGTAQIKAWNGDFKGAEDEYRQAIDIDPGLPVSWTLFLKFSDNLGDKKLYNEVLTQAKENIPNFTIDLN